MAKRTLDNAEIIKLIITGKLDVTDCVLEYEGDKEDLAEKLEAKLDEEYGEEEALGDDDEEEEVEEDFDDEDEEEEEEEEDLNEE